MKKLKVFSVGILFFLLFTVGSQAVAQCSMCRQAAASNIKQGENQRGRGLNQAILYLMAVPYILGGVGGYVLWRNRKK